MACSCADRDFALFISKIKIFARRLNDDHLTPDKYHAPMDSSETDIHSFILKLWLEESQEGKEKKRLRGHITHVASGERHYLQNLDDVRDFVSRFLGLDYPLFTKFRNLARRVFRNQQQSK